MTASSQFNEELSRLEQRIFKYDSNVNNSGIWLFLATLGCWSIDDLYIRVVAVATTFLIFSHQLFIKLDSFKPFELDLKGIERMVENAKLSDDELKARKFDLLNFREKHLPLTRRLIRVPAYYLATIFLLVSTAKWSGMLSNWI